MEKKEESKTKKFCKKMGMSVTEMAIKTQRSRQNVYDIINGKAKKSKREFVQQLLKITDMKYKENVEKEKKKASDRMETIQEFWESD